MAPSSSITSFLTALSLATSTLAQNPPISTSPTFVLYPYITSGSLTGPYPNAAIDKSQPLRPTSGRASGTWTTDCFNRLIFTSYIGPTHCSGEQCGYQRWSLNATDPSAGEEGQTLAGYITGLSSMLIGDADEEGRRDVGWTASACGNEPKMEGFSIGGDGEGEEGVLHLRYEDGEGDGVGTFFTCWVEGDIYGPRVFYRGEGTRRLRGVRRCCWCLGVLMRRVLCRGRWGRGVIWGGCRRDGAGDWVRAEKMIGCGGGYVLG